MSVAELNRKKDVKAKSERKTEAQRPPKYHVIFNRGAQNVRVCCVRLLCDVFNISEREAKGHLKEATNNGRSIIMTDHYEVADTYAQRARDEVTKHVKHNPNMSAVSFKIEKAPK